MAIDYNKMAELALRLISTNGRVITISKLSTVDIDPSKPWRGAGVQIPIELVETIGAFVIPNTSIPTESRGLALDWVDEELLRRVREVCLVPAKGLPILEDYALLTDDATVYRILWGQAFRPGPIRLFYVFGLIE